MIRDFDDLEVYQLSSDLADWIYDLTAGFPADEKYNLISQLKRASTSIGANIAEGYGRYHYKENQQFCRQARGSLTECKHFILFSQRRKYISLDKKDEFINRYTKLKIKLNQRIPRSLLRGLIIAPLVIPAKAGIQKNEKTGFRIKCGMTNCSLTMFRNLIPRSLLRGSSLIT